MQANRASKLDTGENKNGNTKNEMKPLSLISLEANTYSPTFSFWKRV